MLLENRSFLVNFYTYGVQHHERAQRVTHSLEALDEGSGTEMRAEGHRTLLSGVKSAPSVFLK